MSEEQHDMHVHTWWLHGGERTLESYDGPCPNVVAAAEELERDKERIDFSLWQLADALLEETDGTRKDFNALRKEAAEEGVGLADLTNAQLRSYRRMAEAYPPERRYDSVHNKPRLSVELHMAAKDADMLDWLVHSLRKKTTNRLTSKFVEQIVAHLREMERRRATRS